jgi:dolichol kinase
LISAAQIRLGPQEFRRRLWHMSPGVLVLLIAPLPHPEPLPQILTALGFASVLVFLVLALDHRESFRRPDEETGLTSIVAYASVVLPLFALFACQPELAFTVITILALGDGSAMLCGTFWGRRKLPWNAEKSWAGTGAFLLIGGVAATTVYWSAAVPSVSLWTAATCVVPTVFAAGIVESLALPINDNFTVGLTSALGLIALQDLIVGWPC